MGQTREPRHRGTLADRDLQRLLKDFEQAQRSVEWSRSQPRIIQSWSEANREALAREIERRILP